MPSAGLPRGTHSDRSSVSQVGLPRVHVKLRAKFEDVKLLDELLVRTNERRFTLTGKLGSRAEITLSAGNGLLSMDWVVTMVAGGITLPDVQSLILIVWLLFTLFDRLFQPSWGDNGFLVLG